MAAMIVRENYTCPVPMLGIDTFLANEF